MATKDTKLPITEQVRSAREHSLARIAREMAADDRVNAVWLGGSLGRGEGDALSDIDIAVVMAPECDAELVAERVKIVERFGSLVLYLDSPHNAPVRGAQINALYDVEPLPFYIDWNLWPSMGERPSDVRPLFERNPDRMRTGRSYEEIQRAMPRGPAPELTPDYLDHFSVAMLTIVAKLAARGWEDSVYQMYEGMSEPARPQATSR
jgi:predicted nucleotidyltransferase